ncbi:MAG: hypothetical protein KAU01_06830 [Candidatus Cloacimonetes bacterium]|nr:hypothetical protein [Candidatus Cloacimonadota bacterium]
MDTIIKSQNIIKKLKKTLSKMYVILLDKQIRYLVTIIMHAQIENETIRSFNKSTALNLNNFGIKKLVTKKTIPDSIKAMISANKSIVVKLKLKRYFIILTIIS